MAYYEKLSSAIYNDIMSGLKGITSNPNISIEQLEDDIIDERLQIIKEYAMKGLMPKNDLLLALNCIPVDCQSIERCCNDSEGATSHFQIPQILTEFDGIEYIGTTDKLTQFIYYTNPLQMKYHKHRSRFKNKPYVYVDITPNKDNLYDCYIFNAPLIKQISVMAIFKDPRQLELFGCCDILDSYNMTFIDAQIKQRLTEKKLKYYRQLIINQTPNNQVPK